MSTPRPPDDEETRVTDTEVTTTTPPRGAPSEPLPAVPDAPDVVTPGYVVEDEYLERDAEGNLHRVSQRTEEPPRRRRTPNLVPAMLIILVLVLGGLAALWYFTQEDTEVVPSVTGQTLTQAIARLEEDGFDSQVTEAPNDADEGVVFAQDPTAGSEADEGSTVTIDVSTGPATTPIPNAIGLDETAARDRMATAGFEVNVVEVFSDEPDGTVVAQNPAAGSEAAAGKTVRLNVSKGSGLVDVPSVVGLLVDDAVSELEAVGLDANVVEVPSAEPAGTVVAQNPTSGQAQEGSSVRLNVAAG